MIPPRLPCLQIWCWLIACWLLVDLQWSVIAFDAFQHCFWCFSPLLWHHESVPACQQPFYTWRSVLQSRLWNHSWSRIRCSKRPFRDLRSRMEFKTPRLENSKPSWWTKRSIFCSIWGVLTKRSGSFQTKWKRAANALLLSLLHDLSEYRCQSFKRHLCFGWLVSIKSACHLISQMLWDGTVS